MYRPIPRNQVSETKRKYDRFSSHIGSQSVPLIPYSVFHCLHSLHHEKLVLLFYFFNTSIKQALHHKSYFSTSSNGAKHLTQ